MSTLLQDAANSRKDKLALLKKRKQLHDSNPTINSEEITVFKFRNYDPSTLTTKKHNLTSESDTVEKQVEGLTEQVIKQDELLRSQELDITNIQPKKPNWDLKRDLERKLVKLNLKTDIAISNLIRKRLLADQMKGAEEGVTLSLVNGPDGDGIEDSDED